MSDLPPGTYIPLWEALLVLFLIAAGVALGYRRLRRQHQEQLSRLDQERARLSSSLSAAESRLAALESELAQTRKQLAQAARGQATPAYWKELYGHLQWAIAHDFVNDLMWVLEQSEETLKRLDPNQTVLREKQEGIVAKSSEMIHHAQNIVGMFALQQKKPELEPVRLRKVAEKVVIQLLSYAEGKGVTVRPELEDVPPLLVSREFVTRILANVVHNAIQYSPPGSVVHVRLTLRADPAGGPQVACIEVRDRGRGIEEKDRERIFELRTRADGLIEPGSGLGLYFARKLARLQGGDVVLVESAVNQGSTFEIRLPYT